MLRTLILFFSSAIAGVGSTGLLAQDSAARGAPSQRVAGAEALDWAALQQRTPWVFLGDSNTYAGGYVAQLDVRLRALESPPKLLNLGVSSETASGLSEVDHPFKRPCVHERLSKVLTMTRPGVVFVCYGMNDGIYAPPSPERLQAYQAGMLRLAEAVHASGAVLVCLTPPIFEPEPLAEKGKLGPAESGRYAYFAPYPQYDDVLEQQTQWCLDNEMGAQWVIDLHAMLHAEKKKRQTDDPSFVFSGDGIHFNSQAHAMIAERILRDLPVPDEIRGQSPAPDDVERAGKRMQILRNAYLSATGKNRPGLPAGDPIWYAERAAARLP
ncbi:MAG: hypothetical protein KDA45_11455 [Planctomycetales bacterium]|nr:hypothetical protein [Planctomycetales bacterium]